MKKLLIILLMTSCGEGVKEQPLKLTSDQKEALEFLEREDAITSEPQNNSVYIKPLFWNNMDFKAKENFAAAFAIHCQEVRKNNLYYCTVYDKMSGKKLAKYSRVYGFDVY